ISGRVRVYGELSKSFRTQSGVRQGCPLSPFLFNFVIDEIMRRTLEGLQNPGVQIASEENLVDLEYADDIVLMFEEEEKAQVFLDELTKVIPSFEKSLVSETDELAKTDPKKLRLVVIDGSNVAYEYGNKQFNPEGIRLAVEFFTQRGHTNVVAVVPRFRQAKGGLLFDKLEREGHLYYSPSRLVNGIQRASDDDKVILEVAARENGVVVSNDQFRNYLHIDRLRSVIENRLPFVMIRNAFFVTDDPHGRDGPSLSQCLQLP
ncbi:hypothetical protein T265_15073, partial [Opisthorchis viverrini]